MSDKQKATRRQRLWLAIALAVLIGVALWLREFEDNVDVQAAQAPPPPVVSVITLAPQR